MKTFHLSLPSAFGIVIITGVAVFAQTARAQTTSTFTGGTSEDYQTSSNWSSGSVPDLTNPNTALINSASGAVTYNPGGDLTIKNGGTLEVSGGSWTQINGNAYIQLNGTGHILVDGGTFNQGSASSTPFNIIGSGNTFTISSGVANFDNAVDTNVGLTWTQSGGTVNTTGEFDFNAQNVFMSGGVLNTTLLTGVNSGNNGGIAEFNISGGVVNLSNGTGIYGGNANQSVNFQLGSTGELSFNGGTSVGSIQNFVNGGSVTYNGLAVNFNSGDFVINTVGNDNILELAASLQSQPTQAVPEPSTYALLGAGFAFLVFHLRRRRAQVVR